MSQTLKRWPSHDDLGIYIHFPFCRRRCPYCDFNVYRRDQIPHREYADLILKELESRLPLLERFGVQKPAHSLYFGGGSPGLWQIDALASVIDGVQKHVGLSSDAEITIECNPEDVTLEHLRSLKSLGLNRLSLGTQSFHDQRLAFLGRRHTAQKNKQSVEDALTAGFQDLSVDLIWGLAGESTDDLYRDVQTACTLPGVTHVSTYELSIEENTPFGIRASKGEQLQADEECRVERDHCLAQWLSLFGFDPYEVSNAAKPGHFAFHNALYWVMGHYLGLGAGACGFVHAPFNTESRHGLRTENPRLPEDYALFVHDHCKSEEPILVDGWNFEKEAIMVGLRLRKGLTLTPACFDLLQSTIAQMTEQGLLLSNPESRHIAATEQGRMLLNRLILQLWSALPEE